jgi:hypothetical protein
MRANVGSPAPSWQPTVEPPVNLDYGYYCVLKPHAWTQGPVLLQVMALLKGYDLDGLAPTDPTSSSPMPTALSVSPLPRLDWRHPWQNAATRSDLRKI